MKRFKISEKDVIKILQHKESMLDAIYEKIYSIKQEMLNTDEVIEMVALSCKQVSDMHSSAGEHKDLFEVYERYLSQLKKRGKEYKVVLQALILKEEMILRVWSCFLALDDPYYTILNRRYVHNELYDAVQKESGYSLQVFEKYRKRAIQGIIKLYFSDVTDERLQLMGACQLEEQKAAEPAEDDNQMSLKDWFKDF